MAVCQQCGTPVLMQEPMGSCILPARAMKQTSVGDENAAESTTRTTSANNDATKDATKYVTFGSARSAFLNACANWS